VSPADKSLKRPARRPGAEEKFFCPGTRFAVIPLIIEVIRIFPIGWVGPATIQPIVLWDLCFARALAEKENPRIGRQSAHRTQ